MHIRESESPNGHGLGSTAKEVVDRAGAIARLEVELATLELKEKVAALGLGIGLGASAALLAFFAIAFLLGSVAAALALVLPVWAALLIMALSLAGIVAVLVLLARNTIRRATPALPEQAIREAKLTTEALRR
jgi:hypothetical protein